MRKKKRTTGYMIIVLILLLLTAISLYPMWYTLICSFSDKAYVDGGRVTFWPLGFNTDSYGKVLQDKVFFSAFWVSVKRVVVGVPLAIILAILCAYPFCLPTKFFPEGKVIKWFFIANMLFSGGMIPKYVLLRQYNLFESFWVLILPGAVSLWNTILLINFYRNVPYELNEAATIDGANPWQILFQVYVPLSVPSLACLVLFEFVGQWNSWFDGLIYINDVNKQPLQTYIYSLNVKLDYTTMTPEEIAEVATISNSTLNTAKIIVALVPILLVYPFIQKYFVKGMHLGALKG